VGIGNPGGDVLPGRINRIRKPRKNNTTEMEGFN